MAHCTTPSQADFNEVDRLYERYYFNPVLSSCPPKWAPKVMAGMLVVSAVVVVLYVFQPLQTEINILIIDMNAPPIYKTSERYLSVALDSSLIASNFKGFDMRSPKLLSMMQPLGGSYLRIGGTMADRLEFAPSKLMHINTHTNYDSDGGSCAYEEEYCAFTKRDNFTMSGYAWKSLNRLAGLSNFTILFDLNSLRRNVDGSWNSRNAESLIAFSNRHRFDLIWELGNEPNSYPHAFNYELTGEQLARDFKNLRIILNKYSRYIHSYLVGPDITKPKDLTIDPTEFLLDFLLEIDDDVLNAITWHQYYFNGRDAHLSSFLNIDVFDSLEREILIFKRAIKYTYLSHLPVWLGETSSAYGGGSETYSDKFAATFIWLDKLGLAAKNGIDLIVRQSLFKGHYALLDENYDPNPDWWISVMYKKLVGREVLDCMLQANRRVRLYCHCAHPQNGVVNKPAIVVFGSNINYSPALIKIQENDANIQVPMHIKEFRIQTRVSIVSKDVYLNDRVLRMESDGKLPKFKPNNLTTNVITIPPYTLGFWILPSSTCGLSV